MTGSYKPPREFNWTVGVVLLVLTMLLSFTGYLLPWISLRFGLSRWDRTWRERRRFSGLRAGFRFTRLRGCEFCTWGEWTCALRWADVLWGGNPLAFLCPALHRPSLYNYDFYDCAFWRVRKDGEFLDRRKRQKTGTFLTPHLGNIR